MRAVLALLVVPLAGCSNLLGIQDPSTGSGSGTDGGSDDAGIDAMVPDSGDIVKISITDFKAAVKQRVRFHVTVVHTTTGGGIDDITKSSMLQLISSAPGVANSGPLTDNAVTIDGISTGTATITAKYPNAAQATVNVAISGVTCHPVINEFTTGTSAQPDNEFVEIYNPCNVSIDLSNWTLDYRANGSTASDHDGKQLTALAGTMLPNEYRVYAGTDYGGTALGTRWIAGLAKDNGSIALRNGPPDTATGPAAGAIVDSVSYGDTGSPFVETMAMDAMAFSKTAARVVFDGNDAGADDAHDGNNKTNFAIIATASTPGAPNVP